MFNRAGYVYFRGAWMVSILLSLFLSVTNSNDNLTTVQDVIDHDHEYMLYYGLRALVGLVLLFFAVRLKQLSEDAVKRLGKAYA